MLSIKKDHQSQSTQKCGHTYQRVTHNGGPTYQIVIKIMDKLDK